MNIEESLRALGISPARAEVLLEIFVLNTSVKDYAAIRKKVINKKKQENRITLKFYKNGQVKI
jgi:hypothetical protein